MKISQNYAILLTLQKLRPGAALDLQPRKNFFEQTTARFSFSTSLDKIGFGFRQYSKVVLFLTYEVYFAVVIVCKC